MYGQTTYPKSDFYFNVFHALTIFQWKIPHLVYISYKALLAVYTFSWLVYNLIAAPGSAANNNQSPIVFLTTWSYIVLNLHLFLSLINSIYMSYIITRDGYMTNYLQVVDFPLYK